MRKRITACGLAGVGVLAALILVFAPVSLYAAPTAAERKELAAIRREVISVSSLIRRRKYDDARKTLAGAEGRLSKLLKAGSFDPRDRSLLGLKRLIQLHKTRLGRLPRGKTAKPHAGKTKAGKTIRIPTSSPGLKKLEAARKAERERWERDLKYWQREAAKTTPGANASGSPAGNRARYHVGVLQVKLKRWNEAAETFERLIKQSPKGAWTTAATCRLVELKLEHFRDHAGADALLKPLVAWAWERDREWTKTAKDAAKKAGPAKRQALPRTDGGKESVKKESAKPQAVDSKKTPSFVLTAFTEKQNAAEIYRTAAIAALIKGALFTAKRYLLKARMWTGRPSGRPSPDETARQKTLARVMGRRGLTSLTIWTSKKDVFPYIVFADYLLLTGDYERPLNYITAVLKDSKLVFSDYQRSYLLYLRGRSCNGLPDVKQRAKAADDFVAARKLDPKAPWADDCLFLAANARWNHQRAGEKAIALWTTLRKKHPKSPHADRAGYYIGVVHQQAKRYADAKAAYETLLKDRPDSAFAKLTKEELKKVDRELARSRR